MEGFRWPIQEMLGKAKTICHVEADTGPGKPDTVAGPVARRAKYNFSPEA